MHESALILPNAPVRKTPFASFWSRDKDDSDWRKSDPQCQQFGKTQFHQQNPDAHGREHVAPVEGRAAASYTTSTTPHDLYDTGHTLQECRRAGVKLQVNSLTNDKDGMEMRDEIVMVHENDVFVDVGESDVAEQGRYDAHVA